jgi:DNA-binding response OmpR family regulator
VPGGLPSAALVSYARSYTDLGGPHVGTATVLVVDDERKIRELVRSYLENEGFAVFQAETGERALEIFGKVQPDLIVLDLMLPDMPGEEVARTVHELSPVPIIMLTAKSSEDDRVAGLRLGADDYLVKPFSPRELVARIHAVLRRSSGSGAEHAGELSFEDGRFVIDRDSRSVTVGDGSVDLTRSEFDLLFALASNPGRVYSRFELVTKVQGYDYEGYERTIDVHVKNLRKKLGDDSRHPTFVVTVTGVGYKLGMKPDA